MDDLHKRATKYFSAEPRPFLKWAGSKRMLLSHLVPLIPDSYSVYYEPFLGSGALFFLLQPTQAVLSDACADLIATYQAVRRHPEEIIALLQSWPIDKDFYYKIRGERSADRMCRAAEFLYLNKTCWNGLYRVSLSGEFNVPFGAPRKDTELVDASNLRACATAMAKPSIGLESGDFESVVHRAARNDFVFLDPPYVTTHNNNGFIDYNEKLFSWEDQRRLAEAAHAAVSRGAHVLVTNAAHADVLKLYSGFESHLITRSSTLASDATKRKKVQEVALVGRPKKTRRTNLTRLVSHGSN